MTIGADKALSTLSDHGDASESRRHRLVAKLVTNNAGGAYTNVNTTFRVRNPSARLRCLIGVGYRLAGGQPSAAANLPGWSAILDAFIKSGDNGFFLQANSIIPGPAALSTQLPWSYEFSSMVDQLLGTITIPNLVGTGVPPGQLWVSAAWEPISGAIIGDGEVSDLFKQCDLQADNIIASQTGV